MPINCIEIRSIFNMSNFKWVDQQDIFGRFRNKPAPLPFKIKGDVKPIPRTFYLKPFAYGFLFGCIIEASMIKFGYYDAFIKAERKRMLAKETETNTSKAE